MKTIKFRVIFEDGTVQFHSLSTVSGIYQQSVLAVKEVNQYTGLKDKNGKEIYEGDIVQQGDNRVNRGVVEYKNSNPNNYFINGYVLVTIGDEWIDFNNKCEVIGNVHESPELLKDSQ